MNEPIERAAREDYERFKGTEVLIDRAKIGDGNDHEDRSFNPPIRVRVLDTPDEMIVDQWDSWEDFAYLDPIYNAEPVNPDDIAPGEHICWIYGPSRKIGHEGPTERGSIIR